jgi:hypothetical protein
MNKKRKCELWIRRHAEECGHGIFQCMSTFSVFAWLGVPSKCKEHVGVPATLQFYSNLVQLSRLTIHGKMIRNDKTRMTACGRRSTRPIWRHFLERLRKTEKYCKTDSRTQPGYEIRNLQHGSYTTALPTRSMTGLIPPRSKTDVQEIYTNIPVYNNEFLNKCFIGPHQLSVHSGDKHI